jgi:hypothetical protein
MSNAVKNQLMAIACGESPLDRLDKLIHHYENELRLASNDLMKVYLDSNYMDSTSFALSERISIERTKLMIPILLQKDSVLALNHLAIVQNYADSILPTQPLAAQELVRFHDFYSSILTFVNRPGGYFNLSAIEMQTIKDIANEIGPMSSHANSILNFIDKKLPYLDAYDLNGTKSAKVHTEQEKWIPLPEELPKITVFPNPSTGWFEISFEEQNDATKTVEVYNLEGLLLHVENSNEISITLDLSHLFSGLYILKVTAIQSGLENTYTSRIIISE